MRQRFANQGGARAKVKQVELLETKAEPFESGFKSHCVWNVTGSVGHWGHIHTRKNQYEANISVKPVDGDWKITGLELLEEKRIDSYAQTKN